MNWSRFLALLTLCFCVNSYAVQYGDWTGKDGGTYRFIEQYAKTTDNGDVVQRIDFTYYSSNTDFFKRHSKHWELNVTTRYIAKKLVFFVSGERFEFEGGGPFHKLSFAVNEKFVKAIWNSDQPVVLEEKYDSDVYYSLISTHGSAAAMLWATDVK